MARHAYKSEKRRKETARLKKQEEKRQRRFGAKAIEEGGETEATGTEDVAGDVAGETGGAPEEENAEARGEDLPSGN